MWTSQSLARSWRRLIPDGRRTDRRSNPDEMWVVYETLIEKDRRTLSAEQRRFVAFADLRVEVNSGGFGEYLSRYSGDLVLEARSAARDAGADLVAMLIEQAVERLGIIDAASYSARHEALHRVQGDAFDAFDDLDTAYYDVEETADLDSAMRALFDKI